MMLDVFPARPTWRQTLRWLLLGVWLLLSGCTVNHYADYHADQIVVTFGKVDAVNGPRSGGVPTSQTDGRER